MSIALDVHKPIPTSTARYINALALVTRRIQIMWHWHLQAAILRNVGVETLADIGYSQDYVREDWRGFADQYPDTIAPAVNIRRR